MKKLKLLAWLLLFSVCGYSQTVNVGVRGGLSIPNIVSGGDNPVSKGYSSRIAGGGGVFAELGINNYVSFRLGVEYSGQGGKRNGIQAMPSEQMMAGLAAGMGDGNPAGMDVILSQLTAGMPEIFYADVKNTAAFDYLMVPVSVQIGTNANNRWRVYANVGLLSRFFCAVNKLRKVKAYYTRITANHKRCGTISLLQCNLLLIMSLRS